jgi:serine/threonine-protein kinase RsbW
MKELGNERSGVSFMVMSTVNSHHKTSDSHWEVQIPSCITECCPVVDEFISRVERQGVTRTQVFALRNGLHEAVVNAVRHGNGQDPEKHVRIAYGFVGNDVWIEVEDQRSGFDATGVADPCTDANRERPGGRGLHLMQHFMSSVEYNDRGNCVRMLRMGVRG